MHIPSLLKIHCCYLKLSSGYEKRTDGRTTATDGRTDRHTDVQRETINRYKNGLVRLQSISSEKIC